MPTYIVMSKWTSQGLQNVKQSPARLDAAESAGIKMPYFWMVTGQYDMIAILEAPDDAAVSKAILMSSSQGSFTTETYRAFTEDEYKRIIGGLP